MRAATAGALVAALVVLAGCGGADGNGGNGGDDEDGGGRADGGDRELQVLAASSLTEVFEELATTFEDRHPGTTVSLVLDSSATLATQVQEGAPADVLATADLATMQTVLDAGDADESWVFATNVMVMVTPVDNPADLTSFGDLDLDGVTYVACVETAPCGSVARDLLNQGGITNAPSSLEVDVKAVVTKVTSGEADAGLVYETDARAAGDEVVTYEVPGAAEVPNSYALAVVQQADDAELASKWVDLVLSDEGRQVLADAGFGPAP